MNDGLVTSAQGQALVKSFENCLKRQGKLFTTYFCPAGKLTIGWGHTNANGRKFKEGDVWTQGECDAALREDLAVAERAVRRRVKVELTQGQFDALDSFTMNAGEGNLAKSTLLRLVNAGDFEAAAGHFADWNKAHVDGKLEVLNGLTRRRTAEADLFRTDNHEMVHAEYKASDEYDKPCPQIVAPPPGTIKPMSESKIGNGTIVVSTISTIEAASKVKDALDQANAVKASAEGLVGEGVFEHLVLMPTFWLAVIAIGLSAAIWYWRREHAQAGV